MTITDLAGDDHDRIVQVARLLVEGLGTTGTVLSLVSFFVALELFVFIVPRSRRPVRAARAVVTASDAAAGTR